MRKITRVLRTILVCTVISFSMTACGPAVSGPTTEKPSLVDEAKGQQEPVSQMEQEEPQIDLAQLQVNETGKIMVLMYHVIGAKEESAWVQTSENLRRDIQNLYDQGYSLISLNDYIDNNITTPVGRTPIVLTFDDGSEGHIRYLVEEDGSKTIDSDSAVGILLEFGLKQPEFGHTATFYVNDRPFGQNKYWQEKLQELVELGFDIGNHTQTHPKLNKVSGERVRKELAGLAKMVEETVGGYKVRSLALPHGLSPQDFALAAQGEYAGYSYRNEAILKVGANPALGPNTKGFNPLKMPRVQASTQELYKWLEYFQKNPQEKYISDGDPDIISLPKDKEELLEKDSLGTKELRIWQSDNN